MLFEVLASVAIGVSANTTLTSESVIDYREQAGIHLNVGNDLYAWGSAAKGSNYILGQKISSSYVGGLGVGYRTNIINNLSVFVEGGIGYPFNVNNHEIQQEVTYTYLVSRHNVDSSRPVPIPDRPYDQDSYKSDWDMEAGALVRAGVSLEITEHFSTDLSWRYFRPKGYIAIWDQESVDAGGGYWEEHVNLNMNVAELRFMYKF